MAIGSRDGYVVFKKIYPAWAGNEWQKLSGNGNVVPLGNPVIGMRAEREVWYELAKNIPFNSSRLYRISARVRQIKDPTVPGRKEIYLGIAGVAVDGKTYIRTDGKNSYNYQHYFAAEGRKLTIGQNWTELSGYFKGYGSPAGRQHNEIKNPGRVHDGVRYIRPLFILNYPEGDGIADIDQIVIEEYIMSNVAAAGVALGTGLIGNALIKRRRY